MDENLSFRAHCRSFARQEGSKASAGLYAEDVQRVALRKTWEYTTECGSTAASAWNGFT